MRLREVIKGIDSDSIPPEKMDIDVSSVCSDSRMAEAGCLFVALKGTHLDGKQYIHEAISRGASVVVAEDAPDDIRNNDEIACVIVSDAHQALREIVVGFYGNPSQDFPVIGITGTNGKTTITYILESVFRVAGRSMGIIGTVNYRYKGNVVDARNTTPGIVDIYRLLRTMSDNAVDCCAVEVSSHALDQGRVDGICFQYGVFTNLTDEHLDYHKDIKTYFDAKAKLFDQISPEGTAVINADCPYGKRLLSQINVEAVSFGINNLADVMAQNICLNAQGTQMEIIVPDGKFNLSVPLVGTHNVYNILAAISICIKENMDAGVIQQGLTAISVPGRLEPVAAGQDFSVFIDYAHTEDALRNVLSALRELCRKQMILVFGCGGDRDQSKRGAMGCVAEKYADWVVITNDNPRSEDPTHIVRQIQSGFGGNDYEIVLDRKQAIEKALSRARAGDIVLIAGKGHENYQIFHNCTIDFDDRSIVREILHKHAQSK